MAINRNPSLPYQKTLLAMRSARDSGGLYEVMKSTRKNIVEDTRDLSIKARRFKTEAEEKNSQMSQKLFDQFKVASASGEELMQAISQAKTKKKKIPDPTPTVSNKDQPLAVRNNNPGNLKFVGQQNAVKGEKDFAKFATPEEGMLAMRKQIILDTQTRGKTLSEFINKYAPPSENETDKYLKTVSNTIGVQPNQKVPENLIDNLQEIMIKLEGGQTSLNYFMKEDRG